MAAEDETVIEGGCREPLVGVADWLSGSPKGEVGSMMDH